MQVRSDVMCQKKKDSLSGRGRTSLKPRHPEEKRDRYSEELVNAVNMDDLEVRVSSSSHDQSGIVFKPVAN